MAELHIYEFTDGEHNSGQDEPKSPLVSTS